MRWLLILACASLGALLAAQWWVRPIQPPIAPPHASQPDRTNAGRGANVIPMYRLPPLDDYREITERTLFTNTRRPPQAGADTTAETAQPVAQPLPQHLGLTAILMTPDGRTALIRNSMEKEILYLERGADLAGWKIADILPDRLILTQGGKHQEVLLRRFDLAPSPPEPASTPPTAKAKPKPRRKQRKDPREMVKALKKRESQRNLK